MSAAVMNSIILVVIFGLCTPVCHGWFMSWVRQECYQDPPIGCFYTRYPYNNTGGLAPQSPDILNVSFYFHPPGGADAEFVTLNNARQVLPGVFDPSVKTVVIVHGYIESYDRPWIVQMVTELSRKEELNVVVADWSGGAHTFVLQSVANTRVVGAVIALFLQELVFLGGQASQFHLIGFSMGAQVAGYAGSRFPGLGRITGLDPAGFGFEYMPPEVRLDPTDAEFVDVIHTDIASTIGLGTRQPMGTVDFYPNGGVIQPGCTHSLMDRLSAVISSLNAGAYTVFCSHMRVPHLFSSTINHMCASHVSHSCLTQDGRTFGECAPCDPGQCPTMGYNLDPSTVRPGSRVYLPETSGRWPFCLD